ncbi:MAG: hypothetical protein FJW37_12075 [Acidobacteria bacterium]|nr:hypothetical protein [Acidobacteriota bacterium]
MADAVAVFLRWLHITSVAVLIGGLLYWRLVVTPALAAVPESRQRVSEALARKYRGWLLGAIAALMASGLYNFFAGLPRPPRYHMFFGIKMLLALHVFAVGILITRANNPRRERMIAGTVASGVLIILLSAFLRRL